MAKITARQAADGLVLAIAELAEHWREDPEDEWPKIACAEITGPEPARADGGNIVSYRILIGSDIEVIVRER